MKFLKVKILFEIFIYICYYFLANASREGVNYMIKIDCLGEICPIPVIKLREVIDSIKNGEEYMIVTDHSCTVPNIKDFCKAHNLDYKVEEVINGVWEIVISSSK